MAQRMKTVHARKVESNTLTIAQPKGRGRNAPPTCTHKDKRRKNRGAQRVALRKEQGG